MLSVLSPPSTGAVWNIVTQDPARKKEVAESDISAADLGG